MSPDAHDEVNAPNPGESKGDDDESECVRLAVKYGQTLTEEDLTRVLEAARDVRESGRPTRPGDERFATREDANAKRDQTTE
jgi:hypothetical protein